MGKVAPRKLAIVAILYFAEGFPFGFVLDAVPIFLRQGGATLETIGVMSLVTLPWSLKLLWAPAVDRWFGEKAWILSCQIFLAGSMGAGYFLRVSDPLLFFWLLTLAFFSATQDIACDAYTIRLLDRKELGVANGVRVSAYRIALILSGGVLVGSVSRIGWHGAFLAASGVMALCALASSLTLPASKDYPSASGLPVMRPFRELLQRPSAFQVLLFIVLYKLGDMAMGPMVKPFWVDRGLSPSEIGFITGTGGIVASILGALVGGYLTSSWGIFKALWVLGILQAGSNLGYAFVAAVPETGHMGVYVASLLESFCGGLGTAPFLAFLMAICSKEFAATQYAVLSALFGIARSLAGTASGWLASSMGYEPYFTLTFLMAGPAFLLLPWVRKWSWER